MTLNAFATHRPSSKAYLKRAKERIVEIKVIGAEALQEARKRAAEEVYRAAEKLQQRESELIEARKEARGSAAQLVDALQRQVDGRVNTETPPKKS